KEGGAPRFEFRPLPRLAQISPVFGLAFTEVDGDGRPDLYLVQNFFGPQRETGRMNGGVSLLLMNRESGFEPVWPDKSGLIVPGDASSLSVTDLNADGLADFHIGINDGEAVAFAANPLVKQNTLCVQLRGPAGNPDAAGARVSVIHKGGRKQTQQVSAGGGYLSQSSPRLFFGTGEAGKAGIEHLEVVWPNGKKTTHQLPALEQRGGRYWIKE
ncbi:MAG: CRTAC1 family protein, partial [bacterium]|nr:CRTAC1 family protein [bacterium]